MTNQATEKQTSFITTLLQDREVIEDAIQIITTRMQTGDLDTKGASGFISYLLACPRRERVQVAAAAPATLEDGMYRVGETIYKLQHAVHGSGRQYAKQLTQDADGWRFEYAAGAVYKLTPAHRMTVEDAKAFGALYGTCCVCGRTLTDENSIAAGIGPVCAKKV